MDFSKIKSMFENLISFGHKKTREIYSKFNDENDENNKNDKITPLISPNSTQTIEPVPVVSNDDIPIIPIDYTELQEKGKKLREILGSEVSEIQIQQLIENYNTVDAAVNGYMDNQQIIIPNDLITSLK